MGDRAHPGLWKFQLSLIHVVDFFGLTEAQIPQEIPIPPVEGGFFSGTLQIAIDIKLRSQAYNAVFLLVNKGGKFLKKLRCCVGGSITR